MDDARSDVLVGEQAAHALLLFLRLVPARIAGVSVGEELLHPVGAALPGSRRRI
ncbi:MAG: hypothetical protein ACLPUO_11030 [Streptosporangiaceae bacterium]